jgi:hypothetical protein
MTFCMGWIVGDQAFLIGDSLVTRAAPPATGQDIGLSSFGEATQTLRGDWVLDTLLKVTRISENAAIAIAGDVQVAVEIVHHLIDQLAQGQNVESSVATLRDTFSPGDPRRLVKILLAWHDGERPRVGTWSSDDACYREPERVEGRNSFSYIGTLPHPAGEILIRMVNAVVLGTRPPERALALAAGLLRLLTTTDALLEHGVGGCIAGLLVDRSGVRFQPDTIYIIFDGEGRTLGSVTVVFRGAALCTLSTFREGLCMTLTGGRGVNAREWRQSFEGEVREAMQRDDIAMVVLLNATWRSIVLVARDLGPPAEKHVTLRHDGFSVACTLSNELVATLLAPLRGESPAADAIPMRVAVRTDYNEEPPNT